jgi:hypothetical protein
LWQVVGFFTHLIPIYNHLHYLITNSHELKIRDCRRPLVYKVCAHSYIISWLNTTEEDLGEYVCEAQLNSIITKTKVILRLAGKSYNFSQVTINKSFASHRDAAQNVKKPTCASIVGPWDMMESLCHHLRARSLSYWHDSTAVPGIVIYCVFSNKKNIEYW